MNIISYHLIHNYVFFQPKTSPSDEVLNAHDVAINLSAEDDLEDHSVAIVTEELDNLSMDSTGNYWCTYSLLQFI